MDIQLLSDIHLEMNRGGHPLYVFDFPVCAPNLALLGDIGWARDPRLFEWLNLQLTRFERVFFILGNHEAYRYNLPESVAALEAFENRASSLCPDGQPRGEFIFLNRKRYDIGPSLTILGCTLWSSLDPNYLNIISSFLNDFHLISNFKPPEYQAAHQTDLTWLSNEIEHLRGEGTSRKVIVFTHHAPTVEGTSAPQFIGTPTNSAFATELTKLPLWGPPVTLWAYGHTHWSCDFERWGIRVVSNQRGYYREPTGFDERKVISV
ncbi:hypothetical protein Clacol_005037 [Clathrus columnatus]|uniref:Calcineurin-like phosphoesterase domain-containing protein n=1 Tax=Clathrus columnatus TaxID=1419009 RepID=A0AAV5ADM2_9AGAM|nr:hypothetical protein Clacol_005037 [Clathrus columnatus]